MIFSTARVNAGHPTASGLSLCTRDFRLAEKKLDACWYVIFFSRLIVVLATDTNLIVRPFVVNTTILPNCDYFPGIAEFQSQ